MSENISNKINNITTPSPLTLKAEDEIFAKRFLRSNNQTISNNEQPGILEVYADNFVEEIKKLSSLLDEYNYIGMDTEYPGTVYCVQNFTNDFYYKTLKMNVDKLKLIQVGITLMNSKGEFPKNNKYHTWQFNFEFDKDKEEITTSSLSLLEQCGIDFNKLKRKGIKHKDFAEYFMVSGLVLNPDILWVSFHGCYDFGYLLKLLISKNLPNTEKEFLDLLDTYFINYYDIKNMVKRKDNVKIGLNSLAQSLVVLRKGKTHQAGSDSVVTIDVFFKLKEYKFWNDNNIINFKNTLFGISNEEDNQETLNYEQFCNLGYQNNNNSNNNNILYQPYANLYNYYLINPQQNGSIPTQINSFMK